MLQLSAGVLSQAFYAGVGDVDDCWAVADLQGVLATAPHLHLVTVPRYREAAGNPDRRGPTGGTTDHSAAALAELYPSLQIAAYRASDNLPFGAWADLVAAGRASSVEIIAGDLPTRLRYGFGGRHRVLVAIDGDGFVILDPLAKPHSRPREISRVELAGAVRAAGPGVRAIVFPTVDEAFRGHPLLAAAIARASTGAAATVRILKEKTAAFAADVAAQ